MSRASALATLGLVLGAPALLSAQIDLASSLQSVGLVAVKQGWVSVSLPGGSSASISGLVSGPNEFPPVPVATSWNVDPERTATVTLLASFAVPGQALSGSEGAIPASRMLGRLTGSAAGFAPFAQAPPAGGGGTAGGTLELFTQPLVEANAIGTRTDGLEIRIDLTTLPGLPSGTYTGTLNLVAVTQ